MDFTLCLSFLILLPTVAKATTADAASLCYSFTVGKSRSEPWRYKVQGQLNEETFLSYDSNNCQAIGVWQNRLNATKICDRQVDTLKDGVDLFKEQVVHMKQENKTFRDGRFNGSWDFGLNGHKMVHVDSSTGEWTEVDPGSSWMKEMWEKNKDVTDFLKMTSQGDCRAWLEEIQSHWEENLEPTASTTAAPDVNQPTLSLAIKPSISVPLIILPCSVLLWSLRRILDSEGTDGSVVSGRPNDENIVEPSPEQHIIQSPYRPAQHDMMSGERGSPST
ncbi:UL16-binding protein 1-like [Chionomys nivalis]|uniref:UL16-binding protein 1-like n=1 Tax=Chionomys nivalis TaxID=269649 RepID=UPI00259A91FC|nr:UL16-binding protein 1-like [Chionomys nivalis]